MARQNRLLLDLYRGYNLRSSPCQFVCRQCQSNPSKHPSRSFSTSLPARNELRRTLGSQEIAEVDEGYEGPPIETPAPNIYQAAETWHGLEWVGTEEWQRKWRASKRIPFASFLPRSRELSPAQIQNFVHRAIVEIFTIKAASMPVRRVSQLPSDSVNDVALATTIGVSEDGNQVTLGFPSEEARLSFIPEEVQNPTSPDQQLVENEEDVEAAKSVKDIVGNTAVADSDIEAWRNLSLADPEIKFAVLKRVMQLSGIRVPDHSLHNAFTAGALYECLILPPKQPKLAQGLLASELLAALPNVKISGKKISEIQRETEVGRWKVIKEELRSRDLPLRVRC
ncbi:hypothetical protein P152DRAFT_411479 [Eremomyces bilateralis CBS 781.70]|uniref:Large ribosomal subunit protein mL50 n=1 Tax=Eremomyces bilateralis CBS 781.70 TaxID=1392243 RepID=A0A6G1G9H0_9PEZI|nr:uncharacterized protein P152DRAFT_411479 [Eremomyces bilateralis CBS 781.70]KAF1814727.1 hypothetical protein P152DRAFT_411479 [Eremomyces bilateralis CBS 781.70]